MQDFDQFQMPPALVQQLYNNSVFTLNKIDEKQCLPLPLPIGCQVIGSSRNNLAVIVSQVPPRYNTAGRKQELPEATYLFLENILKACRLQIGETLILLLSAGYKPAEVHSILQGQGVSQVLMFGIDPTGLELPALFPAFQPQQLAGRKFLWAPPLDQLEDKESKKSLWGSLKQFFSI
jgi:hypothetical protein